MAKKNVSTATNILVDTMVTTYGDMVPLFVTVQFFLLRLKEQSQQNIHRLFGYLFLRMQCIRGVSKRLLFG